MYTTTEITEALRNLLASDEILDLVRDGELEVCGIVDGEFVFRAVRPSADEQRRVAVVA